MRTRLLSLFIAISSRMLLRRDRRSGALHRLQTAFPFARERIVIASGERKLSGVYVRAGDDTPAILICHGIGEVVEYWAGVQGMLREMGISSLVFNYSGYGESSGSVSVANCEDDSIAAYGALSARGHPSIVLLGYSLGTAVSCAVAPHTSADGLILCEGFSSVRDAAAALGLPRWLARAAPDLWTTVDGVRSLEMPVLVVHSDDDELFPLWMARSVAAACGARGELTVMRGVSHNAPIFSPTQTYWCPIADWVKRIATTVASCKVNAAAKVNQR